MKTNTGTGLGGFDAFRGRAAVFAKPRRRTADFAETLSHLQERVEERKDKAVGWVRNDTRAFRVAASGALRGVGRIDCGGIHMFEIGLCAGGVAQPVSAEDVPHGEAAFSAALDT